MTIGDKKRKNIFNKYSNNLILLNDNGLLPDLELKYEKAYICPICLDQFSEKALNQKEKNPLTLEDVPLKSLGGSANILTCKKCNNECGQKIDYHLVERMRELDHSKFLPKSEFDTTFEKNGKTVKGKIRIEQDGKMTAIHSKKYNNPTLLESFIKSITSKRLGTIISLKLKATRVNPAKLQIALLKSGYLLTFFKFGYSFILDSIYNSLRRQLLNPDSINFPTDFWFQPPYPRDLYGTHFIIERNLEAVMPIFPLKTKSSERPFATIINLPIRPVDQIITEIKTRFQESSGFPVEMNRMGPDIDYLTNVEEINKMLNWINERKNTR